MFICGMTLLPEGFLKAECGELHGWPRERQSTQCLGKSSLNLTAVTFSKLTHWIPIFLTQNFRLESRPHHE